MYVTATHERVAGICNGKSLIKVMQPLMEFQLLFDGIFVNWSKTVEQIEQEQIIRPKA